MRDDGELKDLSHPVPVSRLAAAFPTSVRHLMPAWEDIPKEYRDHYGGGDERAAKYIRHVRDWFFLGLKDPKYQLKDGIDGEAMMRHIGTIMGSWEPKHEHKEAAVAYLLSLWTTDVKWKPRPRERPTNNSKRRG